MIVRGVASTPTRDRDGYSVQRGACDVAITAYGVDGIALLTDHDPARKAGRIIRLWTDGDRLMCEAELTISIKPGTRYGFSIGGKKRRFGAKRIHTVDLREISVTEHPRNPDCWFAPVVTPKRDPLSEVLADMAMRPQPSFTLPPIRYHDSKEQHS